MRHPITLSAGLLSLLLLSSCATPGAPPEHVVIRDIVDAITFRTDDGHLIRMIGIRSPSIASPVECYGKEALQVAESLIGQSIRLEEEPLLTRAQDGAYPRYFWLEIEKRVPPAATSTGEVDPATQTGATVTTEEILVNEKSLEMGTAFPLVSKEMTYGERMIAAATYASATQKGLWGRCDVTAQETPQGNRLRTQPMTDCIIKAKILESGAHIYRTPDCSAYAETTVLQSDGGTWFCAPDTAEDAGFTKADDCPQS